MAQQVLQHWSLLLCGIAIAAAGWVTTRPSPCAPYVWHLLLRGFVSKEFLRRRLSMIMALCFFATSVGMLPGVVVMLPVHELGAQLAVTAIVACFVTVPAVITELLLARCAGLRITRASLLYTMVYPSCFVAAEYIWGRTGPIATFALTPYTQFGVSHLMQMVSVTGIWGVSFLVAWTAEVGACVFFSAHTQESKHAQYRLVAFVLATHAFIMLAGSLRIWAAAWDQAGPTGSPTVRAVGLTPPSQVRIHNALIRHLLGSHNFDGLPPPRGEDGTASDWVALANAAIKDLEWLVFNMARQADAGAGIILLPELALHSFEGPGFGINLSKASVVGLLQAQANALGLYIAAGISVAMPFNPTVYPHAAMLGLPSPILGTMENRLVLVGPGRAGPIWDYAKGNPLSLIETPYMNSSGDKPMLGSCEFGSVDGMTVSAQISGAICFDMEFPWFMRGAATADLLLNPSFDWPSINPLHAHIVAFRAIELGANIFHHCQSGTSIAVDYLGRVLSFTDHFAPVVRFAPQVPEELMPCPMQVHGITLASPPCRTAMPVAYLPLRGVSTVYSVVGDTFAYLACSVPVLLTLFMSLNHLLKPATPKKE